MRFLPQCCQLSTAFDERSPSYSLSFIFFGHAPGPADLNSLSQRRFDIVLARLPPCIKLLMEKHHRMPHIALWEAPFKRTSHFPYHVALSDNARTTLPLICSAERVERVEKGTFLSASSRIACQEKKGCK